MSKHLRLIVSSCVVTAAFVACPPPPVECIDGTEETCPDAGSLPPDFCDSMEEAESDATNCHLTIATGGAMCQPKTGVYISRLLDGGIDQDFYFATAPANLTPRSLLHLTGGYSAPQSAVNFSVNVLKQLGDGGFTSVATAVDKHGPAAPRPVDAIVPFGESNARLFALVADEGSSGQIRVDNRNTYSLCMEIIENPDSNEPNDSPTMASAITLAGSPAMGSATGYLATNDDVDQFSFQLTGGGRQIIYLHITGPSPQPMPPTPYRLSYTLYDPSDRPISEGSMANEFLDIDLSTARLAPMTGTYRVEVKGFRAVGNTLPIKGDLRVQYTVAVQILPDIDAQEGANGNDTAANAKPINVSPNGRLSITGKLSYVPDEEWFLLSLPARATPSTLRYHFNVAAGGGRFAPLTGTPERQVRILKQVTMGATAQDRQVNCRTNSTACYRGIDADPMLVDSLCNSSDPPQCLYAQRNEENPRIPMLRNMVGAVPVFANQATDFLIMVRDEGQGASKYADDKDWTLDLDWVDDADEASRLSGPTMITVGGTTSVAAGELTFGYGKVFDPDQWFMNMGGLRGRADYDAYDTDKDLFQFNLGGATGDQAWEISWQLLHADGGTRPAGDIALEFTFCGTGPVPDGGLCAGSQTRIFGYNDQSLTPWYLPQSVSNGTMLFSRTSTMTETTITALPIGCTCLSASRAAGGVYYANIAAIDRVENDPIRYRISQRMTAYPGSFTGRDGGASTCPVVDGGCGFAR